MAYKSIIFSADEVQAIMDGRKTTTRRVIKARYDKERERFARMEMFATIDKTFGVWRGMSPSGCAFVNDAIEQPHYQPGDTLWVREQWRTVDYEYCDCRWSASVEYADGSVGPRVRWYDNSDVGIPSESVYEKTGWRPSIHMPREAARLFLRVTGVRVERVQEITDDDAKAEGVNFKDGRNVGWEEKMRRGAPDRFRELWNDFNAKRGYGWDANPWVWVYSFEPVAKPERWPEVE